MTSNIPVLEICIIIVTIYMIYNNRKQKKQIEMLVKQHLSKDRIDNE